jgi:hypothetical protein
LEGSGGGLILRHYAVTCLKGLRRTTKNLSQYHRTPGRDLNPGPSEYQESVSRNIIVIKSVKKLLASKEVEVTLPLSQLSTILSQFSPTLVFTPLKYVCVLGCCALLSGRYAPRYAIATLGHWYVNTGFTDEV